MTTSSNGLDMLNQQRANARSARTVPPPAHKAPPGNAAVPEPGPRPAIAQTQPPSRVPAPAPQPKAGDLIRSTIHVDAAADRFLEDVRSVGRQRSPRVDASRSAIVRLAVERLAEQLAPDQVVDELATRGVIPGSGIGRPRR